MLVYTLKRAAGEVCFGPGESIDLPDSLVESMLAAGAVKIIKPASPQPVIDQQASKKTRAKAKVNDGPEANG
jgi:hypothetical protein